jgi:hypothetical protein
VLLRLGRRPYQTDRSHGTMSAPGESGRATSKQAFGFWPGPPVRCPRRHSRFLGACGHASTGLGLALLTPTGHHLCIAA